jgi:tol-pal system protein YbgF
MRSLVGWHQCLFTARALALVLIAAVGTAGGAIAQQNPPSQWKASPPSGSAPPSTAAPKAATKAGAVGGAPAAAKAGGDNPLSSRVEQLEEQLVDMQVTIGTLESLARTSAGGGAASSYRAPASGYSSGGSGGGASGGDGQTAQRIDGLEIQLRALVAQVEQLADQVRAQKDRRSAGGDAGEPQRAAQSAPPQLRQPSASPGFGSTTVTPGGGDPIGRIIGEEPTRPMPAAVPAGDGSNPKQLYETAYGYLLQQNYGAAETAFDDFLVRHPNDGLAGNAQYWLGESFFVRGQYKQAAGAFLKGYQTYARSAKAPDSLLKLSMSLDRLGQKDAACSSYNELNTRFPTAAQNIKARADSERRRIGC